MNGGRNVTACNDDTEAIDIPYPGHFNSSGLGVGLESSRNRKVALMQLRPTVGKVEMRGENYDTLRVKLVMLIQMGSASRHDLEDLLGMLEGSISRTVSSVQQ